MPSTHINLHCTRNTTITLRQTPYGVSLKFFPRVLEHDDASHKNRSESYFSKWTFKNQWGTPCSDYATLTTLHDLTWTPAFEGFLRSADKSSPITVEGVVAVLQEIADRSQGKCRIVIDRTFDLPFSRYTGATSEICLDSASALDEAATHYSVAYLDGLSIFGSGLIRVIVDQRAGY